MDFPGFFYCDSPMEDTMSHRFEVRSPDLRIFNPQEFEELLPFEVDEEGNLIEPTDEELKGIEIQTLLAEAEAFYELSGRVA